jgi:molecular chaperone GrpE (heat shock protein)
VEEDEGLALTQAELQDMIEDLETLYDEIIKLITRMKDLQAHSKNYRKQLQKAKYALLRNKTILDKILTNPYKCVPLESLIPNGN